MLYPTLPNVLLWIISPPVVVRRRSLRILKLDDIAANVGPVGDSVSVAVAAAATAEIVVPTIVASVVILGPGPFFFGID